MMSSSKIDYANAISHVNPCLTAFDTLCPQVVQLYPSRVHYTAVVASQIAYGILTLFRLRNTFGLATTITFIGCGVVGSEILSKCTSLQIPSQCIRICTRNPKSLPNQITSTYVCVDTIERVCDSDILILAVLPCQLPTVCKDISRSLFGSKENSAKFIFSLPSLTSCEKIKQLTRCPFIFRPPPPSSLKVIEKRGLDFEAAVAFGANSSNVLKWKAVLSGYVQALGFSTELAGPLVKSVVFGDQSAESTLAWDTVWQDAWTLYMQVYTNVLNRSIAEG